jgi:hypothetical protein
MTLTVKPGELRVQIAEAGLDKILTDPQYGFAGKFRIEVRKQPVYVQFQIKP